MLFRSLCFLLVCGGVLSETQPEEATECNPKACQKPDNQKVVCGSDGLTYPNRCQLELVRCKNKGVVLAKRGPCRKQRPCLLWQDVSLDYPQYQFKARCKKNGSYEPGQCHPETDYCWCVTPEGLPIPDTVKPKNTKTGSKPIRCGGGKKKITRSPNHVRTKKPCKISEKALFNNNLMNTFLSEFLRDFNRNASDLEALEWKFKSLDTNRDGALDKREYRSLKRLVAKALKPKKCARAFPKSCDVNETDGRITKTEWLDCLPRNGQNDDPTKDNQENETGEEDEMPRLPPDGVLSPGSSVVSSSGTDDDTGDTMESSIMDDRTPSCTADRKLALEQAAMSPPHERDTAYIPECTPDDHFKKVQCYKSVGYCWCVNEEDGNTIPGTSVKDGKPNCDTTKPVLTPMKGCLDDKRVIFLQELMPFLQSKVKESFNPKNPADYLSSIHNDVQLSSFNFLDKNKNKLLERSEWKLFKEMVAQVKGLKKCGKKLPKYCDINKDKLISLTEWRECLSIPGKTPAFSSRQRLGKTNPLSMLKDD